MHYVYVHPARALRVHTERVHAHLQQARERVRERADANDANAHVRERVREAEPSWVQRPRRDDVRTDALRERYAAALQDQRDAQRSAAAAPLMSHCRAAWEAAKRRATEANAVRLSKDQRAKANVHYAQPQSTNPYAPVDLPNVAFHLAARQCSDQIRRAHV